ncbi:helicase C-terminal domain-containing protein [Xylaria bambusicola]|uniref:helicase C-terminal domain-containing protein n=1 Tax=Xylaria bambusicola TaxID=326684 RepID=UPI002007410B|nr:helicase C-terminal domain-containing protein [Xylaria bambusicola]KAI0505368.1 helicase C-terminal domain-containing protein [Xylaria bambusicola]
MKEEKMENITERTRNIDFHHPYTPYDVQLQFMRTVYNVLERGNGQVGILESPTGTGKSLSLICAALTWLRGHKRKAYEISIDTAAKQFKDEPEWVVEQLLKRKRAEIADLWEEREANLRDIRAREAMMEQREKKRQRYIEANANKEVEDFDAIEEEWLLDEHDEEDVPKFINTGEEETGESREENQVKIYYTSRTHSQLTQFVAELRRPMFPSSVPLEFLKNDEDHAAEAVKHVPLSSRQRLCINPSVARLGSLSAINDRCSELQQSKTKDKCQFIPKADNLGETHQFRDNVLATIPDIEDLYNLGKNSQVCPYYASRTAIPGAEVITLPYPLLLQKSARDALGIKLDGNIVIIDEAHNIMDAIANVYASEIALRDLARARLLLEVYVKRFGKKLKGENRVMVGQVARVVEGLRAWMENALGLKTSQGIVDPNALLKHKGIDQINLFKLVDYIQRSKLAYKIEGYAAHIETQEATNSATPLSSTPVLHTLLSFLVSLSNLSSEGRIFYEKAGEKGHEDIKLSYLLLSPTHAFSSISSKARAVILAGGTMSPFDDYTAHLFPNLAPERITTLSCGHVIPASNLCVWALSSCHPKNNVNRIEFEFSYQKRGDKAMICELGLAILNICTVVPDGVVIFFPSYGYLNEVVGVWGETDGRQPTSILSKLQSKKSVFSESKGGSSDDLLDQYSKAILDEDPKGTAVKAATKTSGALLLSVVGGKMSEGINFSDRLGRCVIIVGLPYPNINSPDWKARIEYIESTTITQLTECGAPRPRSEAIAAAKQAAREFYENACMRAVNQSIGRAIRHRNDYATIVLVDRRFGTNRIRQKLPGWIQKGLINGSEDGGLGQMMSHLNGFFRGKQ